MHIARLVTIGLALVPSLTLAASAPEWSGTLLTGKHDVILHTSKGDIELTLDADAAPKTVTNFIELANAGYYDRLTFHRVIPQFMIQGGDPNGDGTGGESVYGPVFDDEINDIKLTRGTIAMANRGPDTNGSQFFIVQANETPWLDGRHTVFGKITKGLDVLDAIAEVKRDDNDTPRTSVRFTVGTEQRSPASLVKKKSSSSSRSFVRSRVTSTAYETTAREKARMSAKERRARTEERRAKRLVKIPELARGALTWGDRGAPVTMVVFMDLECPACQAFWRSIWPELKKRYVDTGDMRLAIRHFPLSMIHRDAAPAAALVMCAQKQSDALARSLVDTFESSNFYDPDPWGDPLSIAVSLDTGIQDDELLDCYNKEGDALVDRESAYAENEGIQATPTVVLFGPGSEKPLYPMNDLESLEKAIKGLIPSR